MMKEHICSSFSAMQPHLRQTIRYEATSVSRGMQAVSHEFVFISGPEPPILPMAGFGVDRLTARQV
jgi:hypothetical protein